MLSKHLALTFSMFWVVVIANIITTSVCLLLVNQIAKITLVRSTLLIPFIVVLIYLGGFTAHNAFADLVVVVAFGFLGALMVWLDWPRPPLVLGLVLGNWAENYLFISTERYGLSWLSRPFVISFLILTLAAILYPLWRKRRGRLAGKVRQIHLGFPEARAHLEPGPQTEVFDSGNPVKPPPDARPDRGPARAAIGFAADRPLVLVTGGSQGALAINRAVEGALASGAWPPQAQLLWQTGSATFDQFRVLARPGQIIVQPFIDPFDAALAAADLVVSRAGAMTLAEVSAWGIASVLIPLPSSAAGHQHANAEALARADAAVLLEQREASGTALGSLVAQLVSAPARLAHMGDAAGRRARPNAALEIARKSLSLLSNS